MKAIEIPLSVAGINKAIDEIDRHVHWLRDRTQVLLERLAQEGFTVAQARFESAEYDGTNDVTVQVEPRDSHTTAVVAIGASVLFIEFGTGVTYPDNHPEAHELGMNRGEYGAGHGKQHSWGYYGDPGTHGQPMSNKKGNTVIITHGNPANMCMYDAVKHLESELPRIAKEVYR